MSDRSPASGVSSRGADLSALPDLPACLGFHAERTPDLELFTFYDEAGSAGEVLTVEELHTRARGLAGVLLERCRGAVGARVLLLYPTGPDFIVAFMACLYARLIAVPAYPPRRNRNAGRLRAIIDDAQPEVLLTNAEVAPAIGDLAEGRSVIETDGMAGDGGGDDLPERCADDIAMLQYTSGSTGRPKGVALSHRNLRLIGCVLQPLYLALPCALLTPSAFLRDPSVWLRVISEFRATTSGAPNFAYDLCAQKVSEEQRTGRVPRRALPRGSAGDPSKSSDFDRTGALPTFPEKAHRPDLDKNCPKRRWKDGLDVFTNP